jgi:hypothetical protein
MGAVTICRVDVCPAAGTNPEAHPVVRRRRIVVGLGRWEVERTFLTLEEVGDFPLQLTELLYHQTSHE